MALQQDKFVVINDIFPPQELSLHSSANADKNTNFQGGFRPKFQISRFPGNTWEKDALSRGAFSRTCGSLPTLAQKLGDLLWKTSWGLGGDLSLATFYRSLNQCATIAASVADTVYLTDF